MNDSGNELHTIYCLRCGQSFTGLQARFDLSKVFSLSIEDDSLGGSQPLPVLFSARELEALKSEGKTEGDDWYRIEISSKALLKSIAFEDTLEGESLSEDKKNSEQGSDNKPDVIILPENLNTFYSPTAIDTLIKSFNFRAGTKESEKRQVADKALKKISLEMQENKPISMRFIYSQADNGQEFISSLQYQDGERIESISERRCPSPGCDYKLPKIAGRYQQSLIGMLGTSWTGKTSYMTSLAYHLLVNPNSALIDNGLLFKSLKDDEDWKKFSESVLKYKHGIPTEKTTVPTDIIPFFTLFLTNSNGNTTVKERIISFIDIPGETLQFNVDEDFINNRRRILNHCELFMLCIDPTQLAYGNSEEYFKKESLTMGERTQVSVDVIVDNIDMILKLTKKSSHTQSIAIMLTKSDALLKFEAGQAIKTPMTNNSFNQNHAVNLRQNIDHRRWVITYFKEVNQRLFQNLQKLSDRIAFFAVSAHGQKPAFDSSISDTLTERYKVDGIDALYLPIIDNQTNPSAWAIGLPFLWLMACDGCLPVQHEEYTGDSIIYVSDSKENRINTVMFDSETATVLNKKQISIQFNIFAIVMRWFSSLKADKIIKK